jgi:DNA replication and repair protein RecF
VFLGERWIILVIWFLESSYKGLGDFNFLYHPSFLTIDRLVGYQDREIASANTLIGPHRDDFSFWLNGKGLASFGSRGEQRTAVLQLKLAELLYMEQNLGITPVLVLDDVFSELDDAHREKIVEVILNQQTIISAVQNEKIPDLLWKKAQKFLVEQGRLSPLT